MGPYQGSAINEPAAIFTGPLNENDVIIPEAIPEKLQKPDDRPLKIVYHNILFFFILHSFALYGAWLGLTSAKWSTVIYTFVLYLLTNFGITAGAHRLWAHRAYKANLPLRFLLVVCNTLAYQNSVIEWSRDHRVHHKFQETDADPHNAKRGFFFSHMGWLLCRKHEQVRIKGQGVDMSDLYADPLLRFQHKFYIPLVWMICIIIPTWIPIHFWGETYRNAFFLNMFRYIGFLNATWLVNSAAHLYGNKPYDKYINPAENWFVSFFTNGEGWHNYHHTFPWDYKASEFSRLNLTMTAIEFFAKIGWAYDLKTVAQDAIKTRVLRTGDGTHEIWGWGDKDQSKDNREAAIVYYPKQG
ncbi:acyl-CoA Delta-9 desaturase-like [Anthonomus grandis grandis]|uniref:acyl-CoA Delta-9 desaturase-like n=1 Tax=Anthonomus grandis grandis TaxID=2921223 RepID=UPI002165BAF6|nr:acyl-CoA Delta-9 desaturase-like [Anthonomus grandis grandis]XP_050307655.1 acyl-CoA Delta-9 desaturase-like [Anthonomus grandis grandis]